MVVKKQDRRNKKRHKKMHGETRRGEKEGEVTPMVYIDKYGKFHFNDEVSWLSRDEWQELGLHEYFDDEA